MTIGKGQNATELQVQQLAPQNAHVVNFTWPNTVTTYVYIFQMEQCFRCVCQHIMNWNFHFHDSGTCLTARSEWKYVSFCASYSQYQQHSWIVQ